MYIYFYFLFRSKDFIISKIFFYVFKILQPMLFLDVLLSWVFRERRVFQRQIQATILNIHPTNNYFRPR